jgi:DNA-binding response OmpR family regulator
MSQKCLNILIADDEPSTIVAVSFVLRHSGHLVDAVNDGTAAFSLITGNLGYYHILITDHAMFEISGLDLIARLRATEFQGRIVVLSGKLTRELTKSYLALGADRLISKPFDIAELRKTIADLGSAFEN